MKGGSIKAPERSIPDHLAQGDGKWVETHLDLRALSVQSLGPSVDPGGLMQRNT